MVKRKRAGPGARGRRDTSFHAVWFQALCMGLAGLVLVWAAGPASAAERFRRGDANADGAYDISDGVSTLNFLFRGTFIVPCEDAADTDDNGLLELTDAVYTFTALFMGGPVPPAPFGECGADPTADALTCETFSPCPQETTTLRDAVHVLSRVAYGPSPSDLEYVQEIGVQAYLEEQLDPGSIDESDNTALRTREDALFVEQRPARDTKLISANSVWRYFKGTQEPPATWKTLAFDDSSWPAGAASVGYGDGDDLTVLEDMRRREDDPETPDVDESQPGYASVYIRQVFAVADPSAVDNLILRIDYDDGFAAYLNGVMVARRNVTGNPPRYNQTASDGHEAGEFEEIDISARRNLLVAGNNVLCVQGHNVSLTSSDLTLNPELVSRTYLPGPPVRRIRDIESLQELVHVRGVYSRRQLQAVLAEFWENHFTTDYDKVAEYFDALQNSDASDAMSEAQARAEAAQVEYLEYQFFYDNALGNFGDLLLFSATSPSMLIYLDNVLNVKAEPNENYAREILELFAFGVDNRYTQRDIEELSRAFTGWTICKVSPEEVPDPSDLEAYMAHLRNPPQDCGVKFEDTVLLGLGPGWKYFKGTEEPTPDPSGEPTTAWTAVDFDDSGWLSGSTGIGYGDGDDATVLDDMRGNYVSVYLRRTFTLAELGITDPFTDIENLILEVTFDDGYVAYLNGVEIGRSENMEDEGHPPAYTDDADDGHEIDDGVDYHNLNRFLGILDPGGPNVLAIQVHNTSLNSSDLSMRPRLLNRHILPGSIENGDPNGVWTFRFDPAEHDTGQKVLFQGTPFQIVIPPRPASQGVRDAIDVIDRMVMHPSTKEFIGIKLIQKFVSDEITLQNYREGTAPLELRELLADVIAAWDRSGGNIGEVMRVILDPENRESLFWSERAYRAKVKTPIEFINSSLRALEANAPGEGLAALNDRIGMHLFTRDDPDGWSELGIDWIDTGAMLERMKFAQALAANAESAYRWNTLGYLGARGLDDADKIIDYFGDLLFGGAVPAANKTLLKEFITTDVNGNPLPFSRSRSDFKRRAEELIGVILSMPQWNFQ